MASAYGQSYYGQGVYGQGTTWSLAGNLAPSVTFAGSISEAGKANLKGDLRPSITYAGSNLTNLVRKVSGGIRPQVTYSASLSDTRKFAGQMNLNVVMAATLSSGPLWSPSPPCPAVEWEEAELCHG
jgi:hypothetical protein